ncbi:hypothetical protein RCL1_006004 [Eukaryota sp. TZLM3-RCL]
MVAVFNRIHLGINPYIVNVYRRAIAAGFPQIDVYMFPNKLEDGTQQTRKLINLLMSENVLNGNNTIWVDIEDINRFFPTPEQNVKFVHEIVNEINRLYKGPQGESKVGIYASKYQWGMLMDKNTDFNLYPLWYPHYDKLPNFSDWTPFGGWTFDKVRMKQYWNTTPICGTQIDYNYYP